MSVKLNDKTEPGELYIDGGGNIHQLFSFCREPTATMRDVATGRQILGAEGSENLEQFRPLAKIDKGELLMATARLATNCAMLTEEKTGLVNQVIQQKLEIADLLNQLATIKAQIARNR